MTKMRPPEIPGKHVPMLSDDHVRLLLADCLGRDLRNRRDCAAADDPELSNIELISRVARITVTGRRDRSCPIGAKTPPDIGMWNMVSEGLLAAGVLP